MLHVELEKYEIKIQHYENLYEQEIGAFQTEIFKINSSYQMCHFNELIYLVKTYIRRRRSLTTKKTIDVYPQIIIDIPKVSLSRNQLDYLSRNGKLRMILFNSYFDHEIHFQDPIILDQIKVIFILMNVD